MSKQMEAGNALAATLPERKHYLDHLIAFAILLSPLYIMETFTVVRDYLDPWWTGLLVALAGVVLYHALARRGLWGFIKRRTVRLLVLLLLAFFVIVPTEKFFYGLYIIGVPDFFRFFMFLKVYGIDAFSQFVLLIALYLMAMLLAPLASYLQRRAKQKASNQASFASKIPGPLLYLFGFIPFILHHLISLRASPGAPSVSEYPVYFLLGFFLLADEGVIEKLAKLRFVSLGVFAAAFALVHFGPALLQGVLFPMLGWFACIAFLGLARRYLSSGGNGILRYLSKSYVAVYVFHNMYIAISVYFATMITHNLHLLILITMLSAYAMIFLTYEILKRFRVTRWMFALKR